MKYLKKIKMFECGSVYLEALLALLIWFLILSSTVPSFLHLTMTRKEMLIEHMGNSILAEQYQKIIYNQPVDPVIRVDGFPTYYTAINEYGDGKELCIYYKWEEDKEKYVCRHVS